MTAYEELRQSAQEAWKAVQSPARPRLTVSVATCSLAAGVEDTLDTLRAEIERRKLDVDVGITSCNGLCYEEPLVQIAGPDGGTVLYRQITPDRASRLVEETLVKGNACPDLALAVLSGPAVDSVPRIDDLPFWSLQERRLMARSGLIDPEDIDHYIANGGYSGLDRVLSGLSPEEVIQQVSDSTLRGRSGSDFPTGRKWEFLRGAKGSPKYLICNADEGDPGAFVNRVLMEGDPHCIIEGLAIAAYATGASYAFMYLRHEYPLAYERMQKAIAQARERGLLGEGILGGDLSFDMEVVRGAGSYVCGEETGLISSVEDSRGMPRIRPPYPAQSGIFAKPTNVNNVETYADVSLLFREGPDHYSSVGTERNQSTKMFSLSGHVQRVGVLEVPLGTPVDRLIFEAGGGVPGGRALKAIQPGGPLAGILPADRTKDLPLEPEAFREHNVQMGGGGIVVVDDSACIVDLCLHFERFAEEESCGRCTTCRGGTQRMVDILRRIARGEGREVDIERLRLLESTMRYANCVHGQAAPTVVMNTLEFFMDELKAHIFERRCPAKVCKGLIRYEIAGQGDGLPEAADICPTSAIVEADGGAYRIEDGLCIRCDACRELAPDAVQVVDAFPSSTG